MFRLAALLLLGLLLPMIAAAQMPGGPPAVGVIHVERRNVTETANFVGRVQAVDRVDLTARVTAYIAERFFKEGDEVAKDDLLFRLERAPFEAAVAQAKASVAQNQALLQNAGLHTGRAQALLNTPAGQRSNLEDAQAQQASYAAQLAAAQAQLRIAEINLDYTEIRAPIAGKIGLATFTSGNVVTPSSQPLARIVSQDPMYVLFPVAVRELTTLNRRFADQGGLRAVVVKLTLPDGTPYDQQGTIDFSDPTVQISTDTITVRAVIANPVRIAKTDRSPAVRWLSDGEFVTVTMASNVPIASLVVPRASVLSDQQGNYVYVVGDGNKVEQRRVKLGQSTPALAVVADGLKEGETVILDGLQRARPGAVVAPGPASPAPDWPAKNS